MEGLNNYRIELFHKLWLEAQEQGAPLRRHNKLLVEVAQGKWDGHYPVSEIVGMHKY